MPNVVLSCGKTGLYGDGGTRGSLCFSFSLCLGLAGIMTAMTLIAVRYYYGICSIATNFSIRRFNKIKPAVAVAKSLPSF